MSFHPLKEIQDLSDSEMLVKHGILDYITCHIIAKNKDFELDEIRNRLPIELDNLYDSVENDKTKFMTERDIYGRLCLRVIRGQKVSAYTAFPVCVTPCSITSATRVIECFDLDSNDSKIVQIPFMHDESQIPYWWYEFGKFVKPWDPTTPSSQASANLPNCIFVYCNEPSLVNRAKTPLFLVVVGKKCGSYLTAVIRHPAPGVLASTPFEDNPHEFWKRVGPYASFPTSVVTSRCPQGAPIVAEPTAVSTAPAVAKPLAVPTPPASVKASSSVVTAPPSSKRLRDESEGSDPEDSMPIGVLFSHSTNPKPRCPLVASRPRSSVVTTAPIKVSTAPVPVVVVADVEEHRAIQQVSQMTEELSRLLPQLHALLRPNMRRDGMCWRFREYWDATTGRLEPVPADGSIPDPTSSAGYSIPLHDRDLVQTCWIRAEDAFDRDDDDDVDAV